MKTGLHPTYFAQATVTCACGAVLTAGSVEENMHTEICSQCHSFYTGKKKFMDTTGRVDRFKKLSERAAEKKSALKPKKVRAPKAEADTAKKLGKTPKTEA